MQERYLAQGIASLFLGVALLPGLPYTYFSLLRWVVCGCLVYLLTQALEKDEMGWAWVLAFVAILYNPIFKVSLEREVWTGVNLLTIGLLAASGRSLGAVSSGKGEDEH
jgi:hypothetical protein